MPCRRVIGRLGLVVAAEQAVEVFGVPVALADEERGVGVGDHVFAEVELVGQDVIDHPAKERDIGPGTQRHVEVRGPVTNCLLTEPFGHNRPREIGLCGSSSI